MVIVKGKIRGKQRPRMVKGGHVYTPSQTVTYEKQIRECYKDQCGELLEGEIKATIVAYYKVPKSYTKKRQKIIENNLEYPMKKPDSDNIAKIVLDSLNGVAYNDDAQVVELHMFKKYTFDEERIEFNLEKVLK